MGYIRSPQADSDLDSIWFYTASGSGRAEIADRLVDSITEAFLLLANYPNVGRCRDETCVLACEVFLWASTS